MYKISNYGRIRSLYTNKILKQRDHNTGYLQVKLYENKIGKFKLVHRIVYESFNGEIDKDKEINHIDGNKYNNKLSNLEVTTQSENTKHAYKLGLMDRKGEKHHLSILTDENVKIILLMLSSSDYKLGKINNRIIGEKFGVNRKTISDIKNNKTWKHIRRKID